MARGTDMSSDAQSRLVPTAGQHAGPISEADVGQPLATPAKQASGFWHAVLRRYLAFVAVASLAWEFLHLPLYTIWTEGDTRELVFAAVHCAGGDVLIAGAALVLALLLVGNPGWPARGFGRVAALTVAFGVAYTIFSEWLNIVVREAWAYSDLMPVIPVIDAGLSPVAQWVLVPAVGFWWARRAVPPTEGRLRVPA